MTKAEYELNAAVREARHQARLPVHYAIGKFSVILHRLTSGYYRTHEEAASELGAAVSELDSAIRQETNP